MKTNEEILQELKLRRFIRKAIRLKQAKDNKQKQIVLEEEEKLRTIIRRLIVEGDVDSDTKPAPYASTALSALADAFNQILPVLKTGLRKLSKPEERRSYRAHVLQKFDSIFSNLEGLDVEAPGAIGEGDLNEQEEDVDKLTIKVDDRPDDAMVVPDFEKDRFKPKEEKKLEPDEDDIQNLVISTEDPVGARFAFNTINNSNIEKLLGDNRKLLPTEEYKQQFKDYAMYNADLWLLTYEKELADELGTEPAFDATVTKKPMGAQVSGGAEEFVDIETPSVAASEDDAGMPELPELAKGSLE